MSGWYEIMRLTDCRFDNIEVIAPVTADPATKEYTWIFYKNTEKFEFSSRDESLTNQPRVILSKWSKTNKHSDLSLMIEEVDIKLIHPMLGEMSAWSKTCHIEFVL